MAKPPFRVPRLMHIIEDDEDIPGFVSPIDEVIENYKIRASRLIIIDDLIRTYYENMKNGDFKNAIWNLMMVYRLFTGIKTYGGKKLKEKVDQKIKYITNKVSQKKHLTALDALDLFEVIMEYMNKNFGYMASKDYGLLTEEKAISLFREENMDEDIQDIEKLREEMRKEVQKTKEVVSQRYIEDEDNEVQDPDEDLGMEDDI